MINYQALKNWNFEEIAQQYTRDFSMLYALSIGLGADPLDPRQLQFVNDVLPGTPLALPTLATVIGYPGAWLKDPRTGVDPSKTVHGEERIVLHTPLSAAAAIVSRHRVTHVIDKGPGKAAIVICDKEIFDTASGAKIATVTHTTFARGCGGFSAADGISDAAPEAPAKVAQGTPDKIFELRTLPQQALLYRLNGDKNPLHSDPAYALAAGFERPILHGLCTYGVAGYAVLASYCGGDPAGLESLAVRFSAPVLPGETIRVELYRDGNDVSFRAKVLERDTLVLDYGHARLR
jgi:acyl dehydratase